MADNVISGHAARYYDETVINGLSEKSWLGSLTLRSDSIGLWFSLDVDPTTPLGMEALGTFPAYEATSAALRADNAAAGRRRFAAKAEAAMRLRGIA